MHRLREEAWVTLDGLDEYAISSYGRVVDLKTDEDLTPFLAADGYLKVVVFKYGQSRQVYIHRLVVRAFFAEYKPGIPIYFKNNNKMDCTVLNLTLNREKVADEDRPVSPPGQSIGGDA